MQFALLYRIGIFARNCEMRMAALQIRKTYLTSIFGTCHFYLSVFVLSPFLSFCLCSITISISLSLFYHHFFLSVFVLLPFLSLCVCSIAISIFLCLFSLHFYLSIFVLSPFLSFSSCSIALCLSTTSLHLSLNLFFHFFNPLMFYLPLILWSFVVQILYSTFSYFIFLSI